MAARIPTTAVLRLGAVLLAALALALPGGVTAQPSGKVDLLWLGQAAWKITTPGGKVIDPWLRANPKTPADYKDLAKLGKVDLILVTRGHTDHVGDVEDRAALEYLAALGQTATKVFVLNPGDRLEL